MTDSFDCDTELTRSLTQYLLEVAVRKHGIDLSNTDTLRKAFCMSERCSYQGTEAVSSGFGVHNKTLTKALQANNQFNQKEARPTSCVIAVGIGTWSV